MSAGHAVGLDAAGPDVGIQDAGSRAVSNAGCAAQWRAGTDTPSDGEVQGSVAANVGPVARRDAPIGVFDSGIGGLSILRALRTELPAERFVYLADSAHAPYGERSEAFVREHSLAVARQLVEQFGVKALVVACNSATACAIDLIRSSYPRLVVVGVEPAVKPAVQASRTRRIGVIGTRATLGSARFGSLLQSLCGSAEFVVQPCDGLATAVERAVLAPNNVVASDAIEIEALCARHISAMGIFGSSKGQIDTLVLGCTHYLFAATELRAITGPEVRFIEPGAPVAAQARRLLQHLGLLTGGGSDMPRCSSGPSASENLKRSGSLRLLSTADVAPLRRAAQRWL